jgi:hypothetical protein
MRTASIGTIAARTLVWATLLGSIVAFGGWGDAAEKEAPPVKIPDTVAGIWQSVDAENEAMAKGIQAGKLGELHGHAFALRDLVAELPARSASLPPEKLAKVKADAKFVATLAQRLDAAGDANNKAAAQSSFEKLRDVLKAIRTNYPDAAAR